MPIHWSSFQELRNPPGDRRNAAAFRVLAEEVTRGRHTYGRGVSPFVSQASDHQHAARQQAVLVQLSKEARLARRNELPEPSDRRWPGIVLLLRRAWRWRPS